VNAIVQTRVATEEGVLPY